MKIYRIGKEVRGKIIRGKNRQALYAKIDAYIKQHWQKVVFRDDDLITAIECLAVKAGMPVLIRNIEEIIAGKEPDPVASQAEQAHADQVLVDFNREYGESNEVKMKDKKPSDGDPKTKKRKK